MKRGGWQWNASFVTDPTRAARLLLVLALAYAWMLTQSTLVLLQQADAPSKRHPIRPRCSVFRLGLRSVKRLLAVDPTGIYVGLFFLPIHQRLC